MSTTELIKKRLHDLTTELESSWGILDLEKIKKEIDNLRGQSESPDFWSDTARAQSASKALAKLESKYAPWHRLKEDIKDVSDLSQLNDKSLEGEISAAISNAEKEFEGLKQMLKFAGPYDDHDAIVSIHSGAGGTDAQDWAQMLYRMYARYCERADLKLHLLEESSGEEAGLKSVSFEVTGLNAYGRLKVEHGVHRLVRLSPFNADNLRQTSFVKVEVLPKIDRPDAVIVDDKDIKIDVFRSGGHGGQSVNTTDSAVRITHLSTGIVVTIQNERSQLQNKETAMTILRSKLARLQLEQHAERVSELKGPNEQAAWGNQIRSYVLHPYKMVKDLRTKYETSAVDAVLDGDLDELINAYLEKTLT